MEPLAPILRRRLTDMELYSTRGQSQTTVGIQLPISVSRGNNRHQDIKTADTTARMTLWEAANYRAKRQASREQESSNKVLLPSKHPFHPRSLSPTYQRLIKAADILGVLRSAELTAAHKKGVTRETEWSMDYNNYSDSEAEKNKKAQLFLYDADGAQEQGVHLKPKCVSTMPAERIKYYSKSMALIDDTVIAKNIRKMYGVYTSLGTLENYRRNRPEYDYVSITEKNHSGEFMDPSFVDCSDTDSTTTTSSKEDHPLSITVGAFSTKKRHKQLTTSTQQMHILPSVGKDTNAAVSNEKNEKLSRLMEQLDIKTNLIELKDDEEDADFEKFLETSNSSDQFADKQVTEKRKTGAKFNDRFSTVRRIKQRKKKPRNESVSSVMSSTTHSTTSNESAGTKRVTFAREPSVVEFKKSDLLKNETKPSQSASRRKIQSAENPKNSSALPLIPVSNTNVAQRRISRSISDLTTHNRKNHDLLFSAITSKAMVINSDPGKPTQQVELSRNQNKTKSAKATKKVVKSPKNSVSKEDVIEEDKISKTTVNQTKPKRKKSKSGSTKKTKKRNEIHDYEEESKKDTTAVFDETDIEADAEIQENIQLEQADTNDTVKEQQEVTDEKTDVKAKLEQEKKDEPTVESNNISDVLIESKPENKAVEESTNENKPAKELTHESKAMKELKYQAYKNTMLTAEKLVVGERMWDPKENVSYNQNIVKIGDLSVSDSNFVYMTRDHRTLAHSFYDRYEQILDADELNDSDSEDGN